MSEEIKVVIALKDGSGAVGVQTPDCDPFFLLVEGELAAVLGRVPEALETARAQWAQSPKYPKANLPEHPPPAPAAPRAAKQTSAKKQGAQKALF